MIFKKLSDKSSSKQVEKPVPKPKPDPLLFCECGNPIAPGQTYVCKDHIRSW